MRNHELDINAVCVDDDEDGDDDEDEHHGVADWEEGLPSADDLTPLSQALIPPKLASAFRISPEPPRTAADVHHASHATFSSLRPPPGEVQPLPLAPDEASARAGAPKRPRLVWTPQLHRRFVEVVAHLGLRSAVPKTIMQLMNVEGLTRENVASHLQKYRLYVKRMQGIPDDEPLSPPPPPASSREPPGSVSTSYGSYTVHSSDNMGILHFN